jgi:rubrerythrin
MAESAKVLEILDKALQMEIDGREFYLKASEESKTPLAKSLFAKLAEEEIEHQTAIQTIYEAIKSGNHWPDAKITHTHSAENIFSAALKDPHQEKGATDDLEAVRIALKMEEKSFALYKKRADEAESGDEVAFYKALAFEEQKHIASLQDTEEYLTDPEGWFMKKQHITLDGAS